MFKMTKLYEKAKDRAQDLLKGLQPHYGMTDTNAVVDIVAKQTNYSIEVYEADFSQVGIDDKKFYDFGGFIGITKKRTKTKQGVAEIFLNTRFNPQMRRFALMHEIGHFVLTDLDKLEEGKLYASAQINADITFLSETRINGDEYLQNEQAANIFALAILMPETSFKLYNKFYLPKDMADMFGVTEDAVRSRFLMLTSGK